MTEAEREAQKRAQQETALAEARGKHEEVHLLEHMGRWVIVRPPTRNAWKRFRKMLASERERSDAQETLLVDCLVHPSQAELQAMLDKRPGLAETFGGRCTEIGGLAPDVEKKAAPLSDS